MVELTYDMKLEEVAQSFLESQAKKHGNKRWHGHSRGRMWQYKALGGTGVSYIGENAASGALQNAVGLWCYGKMKGCTEEQAFWATKGAKKTPSGKPAPKKCQLQP